ncbi:DNA modification methylase [Patescibacteria group bacterium]|nr:DNA modification methylase [Patescibacteria group bacterium]
MNKEINIVYVPVSDLKPAEYNPRKISKESLTQLKESISRFELVDPVIVNGAPKRKNIVIGGHMRLRAAKELGHKTVPVVYVQIPSLKKEQELNLRLNRNTGEWDFEKLKFFEMDFLSGVGFSDIDLSNVWTENLETENDEFDEEKELKQIKEPKTKIGDLIQLGGHRLICGSSTDPKVLGRLFGEERASMIYSDPPYNINIDYNGGIGGKQNYGGNVLDTRTDSEYKEFIAKTMIAALSVAKPDTHVFYWCDQIYIGLMQELYRELGIANKRVCLWLKNSQNPVPSVAFNKCYEPCVYGLRGKPYIAKSIQNLNEVLNKEITTGNNLIEETLDHLDVWLVKRLSGKDYEHATSKPPKLHEKAIRRCTKPGEIILDSFSGSGSTMIAAEQLKRRVYAVELEPAFCDLAIKRYEKLTGNKAKVTGNAHEKE